ncbi:MAG: phosphatase PAP2 family protein [Alphaproteobacteria bacterium]|nr:phosphatase PAP2 family protein [Alphaproteobacteria bacterium]
MLLIAGLGLIAAGALALAVDRRAAHLFYDHINEPFFRALYRTTHWAKGSPWLTAAIIGWLGAEAAMHWFAQSPFLHALAKASLAFISCLAVGSAVLHTVKRVLARRRPRDEMEFGLYGFLPFSFDARYNSFPSGHSLTIVCVAVTGACLFPQGAPLWFAIAAWLSLTRALLTEHFLSDVLVGAGIGLVAARETLIWFFPGFPPAWF